MLNWHLKFHLLKLINDPMKKSILIIGVVLGLVFLNSCSSLKVYSDFDSSADWSKFKTFEYYGWAAQCEVCVFAFEQHQGGVDDALQERRFELAS